MIFRSPNGFAIALVLGFCAAAAAFGYYALEHQMAVEPLVAAGFFGLAALLVARDLRRYRAGPDGLEIQHLITRRTRVIPYPDMVDISRSSRRGHYRYGPAYQEVHVRHRAGTVVVPFFDEAKRDAFADELRGRADIPIPGK